jgi:hypothetical protein
MTVEAESAERSIEWVKAIPDRLEDDQDKALRVDRHGYVGFIRATGYREYELAHKHYHEDEWRRDPIAKTQILGTAARFSHQADVVDMPDLEDVEVTVDDE